MERLLACLSINHASTSSVDKTDESLLLELLNMGMDKSAIYIKEDSPVKEGLKNELDDLIESFQLCFVLYGGKVTYLDIFSYSMLPCGKLCG